MCWHFTKIFFLLILSLLFISSPLKARLNFEPNSSIQNDPPRWRCSHQFPSVHCVFFCFFFVGITADLLADCDLASPGPRFVGGKHIGMGQATQLYSSQSAAGESHTPTSASSFASDSSSPSTTIVNDRFTDISVLMVLDCSMAAIFRCNTTGQNCKARLNSSFVAINIQGWPAHQEQFVQHLAQGHFDMQTRGIEPGTFR